MRQSASGIASLWQELKQKPWQSGGALVLRPFVRFPGISISQENSEGGEAHSGRKLKTLPGIFSRYICMFFRRERNRKNKTKITTMPTKKQLAFIEVKFNKEVFNMLWQYVNNQLGSKNHKYFHYENATKAKLSGQSLKCPCCFCFSSLLSLRVAAAKNFPNICTPQIFVQIFVQFVLPFKVSSYKC